MRCGDHRDNWVGEQRLGLDIFRILWQTKKCHIASVRSHARRGIARGELAHLDSHIGAAQTELLQYRRGQLQCGAGNEPEPQDASHCAVGLLGQGDRFS